MKKTIMKKLLALLSASFMLATCAACSCDSGYLNGSDSPSASDTTSDTTASPIALQTPMHLSFDEENSTLTWDAVDNAVCYLIDHNGEIIENSETQVYVLTQEGENVFKVKAVGDGVNYTDSDWSMEYYYVMPPQQSVYEIVNLKLAEVATEEKLVLEKVLGISSVNLEANEYQDHITFQVLCSKSGVSAYYDFTFRHENPSSIGEILQTFELATFNGKLKRDIVDYDSGKELVDSKRYAGVMLDYYGRGYEISAIQTAVQVGKKVGSKLRFYIVGTFKAETYYDVKYFTAEYQVDVLLPSSNEEYNYIISLCSDKDSTLTERYCLVHEEYQTGEYMLGWAKENDPNYKSEE